MWKSVKESGNPKEEGSYWVYKKGYGTFVSPFWKCTPFPKGYWADQLLYESENDSKLDPVFEWYFDSPLDISQILEEALEKLKPTPFEPERLSEKTA